VHNLNLSIRSGPEIPYPWAERFDATVREKLLSRNWNDLIEYQTLGDDWAYAIPTPDHYLPLLYALGAADELEPLSFPAEGIVSGSMSMRSVLFGQSDAPRPGSRYKISGQAIRWVRRCALR